MAPDTACFHALSGRCAGGKSPPTSLFALRANTRRPPLPIPISPLPPNASPHHPPSLPGRLRRPKRPKIVLTMGIMILIQPGLLLLITSASLASTLLTLGISIFRHALPQSTPRRIALATATFCLFLLTYTIAVKMISGLWAISAETIFAL